MSEQNMPATDAVSYELAFHVLPTVAEGEVPTVFQNLKDMITKAGGTITGEETPARFELAYEIVKYLEGRNRKFSSAYFGWIRFTVEADKLAEVSQNVDATKELLRHLLIRLTKVEEENPFYFHEALAKLEKKTETVNLDEAPADEEAADDTETEEAESDEDSEETEDKVE
ncbi:30S ribosomal protein S6 [Candidatus Kaiserbacteria bacterium]|nr:30S ribosomal protein S6 [Candidatus Kaiserbacteria bacterium]